MGELADQADGAHFKEKVGPFEREARQKDEVLHFRQKTVHLFFVQMQKEGNFIAVLPEERFHFKQQAHPGKLCELAVVFGKQIFADQQVKDGHFSVLGPVAVSDVRRNGEYVPRAGLEILFAEVVPAAALYDYV